MASSSGNSSGCSQIQNSGSEGDLQVLMDQRKRKRMQSNRESARRSRMRKQQHLDELMSQLDHLKKQNAQIMSNIQITTQQCVNIEFENSVLGAQMAELSQRLDSLNDILRCMNNNGGYGDEDDQFFFQSGPGETFMNNNPWNFMYLNQPIMASADVFQY